MVVIIVRRVIEDGPVFEQCRRDGAELGRFQLYVGKYSSSVVYGSSTLGLEGVVFFRIQSYRVTILVPVPVVSLRANARWLMRGCRSNKTVSRLTGKQSGNRIPPGLPRWRV